MKKVISIVAAAAVLGTYVQANAAGIIVKEDFEAGADKWGISYSSHYDTVMPSIIGSKDIALNGDGSLEILPSGKLPYNSANTDINSLKYQGVYYGGYIKTEKNRHMSASVNIKTDGANVRMRYIFMSGNEIKNISDEYILTGGKWMNAEYVFTPDFDTDKGKIVLAFYSATKSGSENSIYLDDFAFRNSFISPDGWQYESGKLEEDNGTVVYTADDFSEYKELTYTINKENIEQGLNILSGEISSDMDDTYISLSADGVNSKNNYHIAKGETVKAEMIFDTQKLGDTVTIRMRIAGNGEEKKVRLSGFDILNEDYIINSSWQNDTLKISGKLKTGNESVNCTINVGGIKSVIETNEDGIYSAEMNLAQMTENYGYTEISITGAKGYAGLYPKTMIYFVKNTEKQKILESIKDASDEKAVEEILTSEVLNNLGIYCEPLFRSAKLSDICSYVYRDKPGTYGELENSLIKNACISAANQGVSDLYSIVGEYNTLLGLAEKNIYKNLFPSISSESFNAVFNTFNGKPETGQEFVNKIMWVLIKQAASKCDVNSEVMALLNKYSSDLGLNMEAYSAAQKAGKGSAAAADTVAWIASMTDCSNIQTKFNEICANAGNSSGSGNGFGGGGISSGGGSGSSGSGGGYPIMVTPPQATSGPNNSYLFSDISNTPWATEYIYMLLNKGIISQSDDNTFRPNDNITRAEFVKMIAVMLGLEEDKLADVVFDDVQADDWYFGYVSALYKKGIVNGMTDTEFGAKKNISRQDICTILSRAMDLGSADSSKFDDDGLIADYAYEAVYKLKSKGCINGYEDNTFRPNAGASRAEVAKIIGMLIK